MRVRNMVAWAFTVVLALMIMVCAGGYVFLKSRPFNQFARRKIAEATEQATGASTTIGGLSFSIPSLTAHLYNITLWGNKGPDQPPVLTIDELTVGFKIQSLLHRKFTLSELLVEHPVANVAVNRAGSNLPSLPTNQNGGSHTNVFELAVGHAQITHGEVMYKNQKIPLAGDVYNLGAEIHFDRPADTYVGSISYENGQLRYAGYSPLNHNLHATFKAMPSWLSIESAELTLGHSAAVLHASLRNYSDPVVEGDYRAHINAADFARFAPSYTASGDLSLVGQVHYNNASSQPLLHNLTVNGQIASQSLAAAGANRQIEVRNLRGTFQLANGALRANAIRFDSLGGAVHVDLSMTNLDAAPSGKMRSSLQGISLQAAQRMLGADIKQVAVTGSLNGTADASWVHSLANLQVRSELSVTAKARSGNGSISNSSVSQIPVNGVIHASYNGVTNAVTLRHSTLRIPSATVSAEGELSRASHLRVQAKVTDLRELESLAAAFRANTAALPAVSGSAQLNGNLGGSLSKPQMGGELSAQDLDVQGSKWRSAHAVFLASQSRVTVSGATLVGAQRSRASFHGTIALSDWQYSADNPFTAEVSLQEISIADLQRSANVRYPVSGDLSATLSLGGTELNPQGSGKVQIANAHIYEQPVQALVAQFHTEHGTVIASLNVATPAGRVDGNLAYTPESKTYIVAVNARSLALQKLQVVQARSLPLNGRVSVSASGHGTLDDPQLSASLQLPEVTVQGKSISYTHAELQIANHKANLTLNSKVVDAIVQAQAQVNLTGDYFTEASVETTVVPLNVLLDTYFTNLPPGLTGQTELHAILKGPLKDTAQLQAQITIPTLNASYESLQIGIASPLHADFAHSLLTLQPAEIRGTDTLLRVQGSIPLAGNGVPSLMAEGSLDVRILKIFAPQTTSSGTVSFNVHASGNAQDPNVSGQISLHDLAMAYSGAPLGVSNLNGTLDVASDSIQLSKLTGQVGGGDVVAGGSIIYRPRLQFNLLLQGKSMRLLYPAGLRTSLDSNLSFTGTEQAAVVTGRVLIDSLGFTPGFDLSSLASQFSGSASFPTPTGIADNIKLDVSVQSKDNLTANSTQLSVEGSVNLRVIGTAANPVIIGRTDLTSGEVFYSNVRYQIQNSIITFDNPSQTSPVLNLSATTSIEQYNLTLKVTGPFDKLTISYTSDPPLATADIISLLAQGQTTEQTAAAGQSTESMIASQATGQFVGGIQKLVGISSLEIDPLIGGNNQNPSARIAIQQRVTKNLLFTFSTDVSQPGAEVVEGDYQINKRWSVNVTRDQVGGISVGAELHTKF